jgi:hypothetical protein
MRVGLYIFLDDIFDYFFVEADCGFQIYCQLCKFGTIKKQWFRIVALGYKE